jgi:hypothetical protein
MDVRALLTKKNLLLGGGSAIIVTLIWGGIRMVMQDPTSSAREAYQLQKVASGGASSSTSGIQGLVTGATSDPVEASPTPEEVDTSALLPDGAKTTPTPEPERPGVVERPVEVELSPVQPQKNVFTTFPQVAVPTTITDASLPSRQANDGTTNVQTVFRTAPGRYLFNNLAPEALGAESMILTKSEDEMDFNPSTFSPMGETIQLAMMENATTENTEINVTASVWEPFYFQGNKLFDVGDKILGVAAPGKKRDRMVINFYKVIFKDGKSLPIQAAAQDIDGTYGVTGIKIGDVMLNSIAPLLLDTAVAFTGIIQELAYANVSSIYQQVPTVNNTQTPSLLPGQSQQNPNQQFALGSTQAAGEGGQTVYQKISEMLAEDIEENKPYLLVPAGTRLQAYLQAPIDISQAEYGK